MFAWSPTGRGVSINPLSTLQAAVLVRQDPRTVFDGFAQWSGVVFSEPEIDAAEDAVADYLQRYVGVTVPAAVRGFATRNWERRAGDPFEDTLVAFRAALAAKGDDFDTLAGASGPTHRRLRARARRSR